MSNSHESNGCELVRERKIVHRGRLVDVISKGNPATVVWKNDLPFFYDRVQSSDVRYVPGFRKAL